MKPYQISTWVGLAADVARCNGSGDQLQGWRDGCETCLRRTAPRPEQVWMMEPPILVVFECEYLIDQNNATQATAPLMPE